MAEHFLVAVLLSAAADEHDNRGGVCGFFRQSECAGKTYIREIRVRYRDLFCGLREWRQWSLRPFQVEISPCHVERNVDHALGKCSFEGIV